MRNSTLFAVVLIIILLAASGFLLAGVNSQQPPTRADSISLEPDPSDPLSQTGSPIKIGEPGDDVIFTIGVKNDHNLEQRVRLTVLDSPSWLIAVTGSVDVPAGTSVEATVTVSIPDEVLDPNANYAILIEGVGNITGDIDSLVLIIELDITIDHDLVLLPYNTDEWTLKVYPGQRTFVDIKLSNLGNMKSNYELDILEHLSGWDVQFRENEETVSVELDHGETGSEYNTRLMIGVPASSLPGETIDLAVRSISIEADDFSFGKSYDEVTITMKVEKGSMVTISPLETLSMGDEFVDVSYELHHSGVVDAVLDFLPSIYQEDRFQTGWDFIIAPASPLIVKVGEIKEVKMRITVPGDAFGYYDLKLDAVSNNADIIPGESMVYISPISDITISNLVGGPFDEGVNVVLKTEVSNNGDLGRQALLDIEGVPEDYVLDVEPSLDLYIAPGSSVIATLTLYPMEEGLEDPFEIIVTVNSPDDEISGRWIAVAQASGNVTYRDLPNIKVERLYLPTIAIQVGEEVNVQVTIANIGNLRVDKINVTLNMITYSNSWPKVETQTTSLGPGEVETLTFKWTAKISTKSLRAEAEIDSEEKDTDDNDLIEDVWVRERDRNNTVSSGGEEGFFTPESATVGGMGLGILGALLIFFGSKDVFRYPFFLALGPLYSKLKPEHLLNNKLRKRIYVFVQNHPGEHFRSILTHLNLTNGTLAHHLYTLEKENLIRSQRDGLYRRFYPAGYQIDPTHVSLTSIQQRIIDLVKDEPGHSQKEISQNLGLSNSTVNYNIKSMKEKGLLDVKKDGKSTRIFPSKDMNA